MDCLPGPKERGHFEDGAASGVATVVNVYKVNFKITEASS